jgi:hypothetical protein
MKATEKKMTKAKTSPLFEQFWEAYPKKVSRIPAWQAWQKHVDESDAFLAKAVIDDVRKRNRMKAWPDDRTKIPMASTYLNQWRWEDEWESEIKNHTVASKPTASTYVDDAPELTAGEMMCNRLMRDYIMLCQGMKDDEISSAIAVKSKTISEFEPAILEDIDQAEDKKAARRQGYFDLAKLFVRRLDIELGRNFTHRLIGSA